MLLSIDKQWIWLHGVKLVFRETKCNCSAWSSRTYDARFSGFYLATFCKGLARNLRNKNRRFATQKGDVWQWMGKHQSWYFGKHTMSLWTGSWESGRCGRHYHLHKLELLFRIPHFTAQSYEFPGCKYISSYFFPLKKRFSIQPPLYPLQWSNLSHPGKPTSSSLAISCAPRAFSSRSLLCASTWAPRLGQGEGPRRRQSRDFFAMGFDQA